MDPQTLALLVSAMTQANGGDPSSAYLDPVLAYLTGSYTPERRWTDEELMAINAPTLSAYTQVGPDGNLVVRSDIGDKDRRKQIEAILSGASPYDVAGGNTDDRELMDFLQSLAEERAKFFQQQISRDSRKDQFEEMGLPGYGKGYTLDQISTMYGDSLGNSPYMAAASERNAARLSARNQKLLEEFSSKRPARVDAEVSALMDRMSRSTDPSQGPAQLEQLDRLRSKKDKSSADKDIESYKRALASEERRASASPGGMGYENLRNQYQMQALASALEASGRTPLSDALVSSAMLKRLLGR